MPELHIYPSEESLYKKILSGKEIRYFLTTRIPLGISVCLGEENISKRFFYRENRPVICLGALSNCRYLLAVNPKRVTDLGGKLG